VVPPVPPNPAVRAACLRLGATLPARLDGESRRRTVPASPLTTAWGDPAVVLRCGVARPAGYNAAAETAVVDGVAWFQQVGSASVTWTLVGRGAYLDLRVPTRYPAQAGFLVGLAGPITAALPATG